MLTHTFSFFKKIKDILLSKKVFLVLIFILFFSAQFSFVTFGQTASVVSELAKVKEDPVAYFTQVMQEYKDINNPKNIKHNWWKFNDGNYNGVVNTVNKMERAFKDYYNTINYNDQEQNSATTNQVAFQASAAAALSVLSQEIQKTESAINDISDCLQQVAVSGQGACGDETTLKSVLDYQRYIYSALSDKIQKFSEATTSGDDTAANTILTNASQSRASAQTAANNSVTINSCNSLWHAISSKTDSGCNVATYLFSVVISAGVWLTQWIVDFFGKALNLAIIFSIYNFKMFVGNTDSGIYTVWKSMLFLITSLVLPFILYLLIKSLIKNDDSFQKALPGIAITSLFVYFSFSILAFVIDQVNIVTIYIYRSMTLDKGATTIATAITGAIKSNPGDANTRDAAAMFYGLANLIVNIMGIFIYLQATILMVARYLVLMGGLVLSPFMLIPETGIGGIDSAKKTLISTFFGNLFAAPIFIFLTMLAIMVANGMNSIGGGVGGAFSGLNGDVKGAAAIINSVIVIGLLYAAINVAKKMSGSAGNYLTEIGTKFAGRGFGVVGAVGRTTLGRAGAWAKEKTKDGNRWMKAGGLAHRGVQGLFGKMATSSYDPRSSRAAKFAKEKLGIDLGEGSKSGFQKTDPAREVASKKIYDEMEKKDKFGDVDEEATKKAKKEFLNDPRNQKLAWVQAIKRKEDKDRKAREQRQILMTSLQDDKALADYRKRILDEDDRKEFDKKILAEQNAKDFGPTQPDQDLQKIRDEYLARNPKRQKSSKSAPASSAASGNTSSASAGPSTTNTSTNTTTNVTVPANVTTTAAPVTNSTSNVSGVPSNTSLRGRAAATNVTTVTGGGGTIVGGNTTSPAKTP